MAFPGRCQPLMSRVLSRDSVVGFMALSIVHTSIRHGARRTFLSSSVVVQVGWRLYLRTLGPGRKVRVHTRDEHAAARLRRLDRRRAHLHLLREDAPPGRGRDVNGGACGAPESPPLSPASPRLGGRRRVRGGRQRGEDEGVRAGQRGAVEGGGGEAPANARTA
eukprot:1181507-Prorocentrum_minimum.AAC.2